MPALVLLFIALPILELLIVIQVARGIGVAPTLALIVVTAIVGAVLLRSQGRAAWARFNTALSEGRIPARETADGAMIIFGGALLLTPGFVTDVTGLALLAPPTRALLQRGIGGLARRRIAFSWWVPEPGRKRGGPAPEPPPHPPPYPGGRRTYDYEGSAREVGEAEHGLPEANHPDGRDG